jgi:hypothetical protein
MAVPNDQTVQTTTYDGSSSSSGSGSGNEGGEDAAPEPAYDTVTATSTKSASRTHTVYINNKYANITKEVLSGAVFSIYENGTYKGTITTNTNGYGSLS